MCGRYVILSPPDAMRQVFGYAEQPNFPPRYNVAPTQPVPVIILENGARHFRLMRWGLIPAWVKDPRQFALVINARSETVLDKPAFKNAMKRRRCLLPADGYYEWHQSEGRKQPFFIRPGNGELIAFAGLAETWVGPNGEELDTVAIVTAAANGRLAVLHSRVPVTVAPADYARWLDGNAIDAQDAMQLLRAPDDGEFVWHKISTRVNRVANDDAQLILPISAEEAAAEASRPAKKAEARKPAPGTSGEDGQGSLF
ncbi:MAG: SOS response-associated peptidase [Proteobacteria bacterium]|nr:SOS response-associated peptidase [Pseudomonadota bacterium]